VEAQGARGVFGGWSGAIAPTDFKGRNSSAKLLLMLIRPFVPFEFNAWEDWVYLPERPCAATVTITRSQEKNIAGHKKRKSQEIISTGDWKWNEKSNYWSDLL
jgi:hypothetical protein